ncbi:hypothetical protein BOTNAR_0024g00420 [Botryotinia narcissicola]|uniref:Uncharacterized protein n=1 Tax=Botryotinia narcissicola TaxID=278944 RepID=A0A4Z1JAC6_9HELO|nr:hypothetical protein BOTNAR_0024g00420 [Botryotinia narcissicola]
MTRIYALPADGDVPSSFLAIVDSPPDKEARSDSSSDELPLPSIQSMVLSLPVTSAAVDQVLSGILGTDQAVVNGVEFSRHKQSNEVRMRCLGDPLRGEKARYLATFEQIEVGEYFNRRTDRSHRHKQFERIES